MSAPRIVIAALSLAAFFGCNSPKSGPATVKVQGTVTMNGSPLEGASVVFYPDIGSDDSRLASQAVTDREGRFQLSTHVGGGKFTPGIVPGKYAVAISKLDTASVKTMTAPPKNVLPHKYADPKTSQFTADVTSGGENSFDFPLSDR